MRKVTLYILNILYALFGLVLFFGGVAIFVCLAKFTALRNVHHYKLDFSLYWPQVIPIVACLSGAFVIFVSCCGCCSASKKNKGFAIMQAIFTLLTLLMLITCAVLTLKFADTVKTDTFLRDALVDGFSEAKTSQWHMKAFSTIERWLECCGTEGASSYHTGGSDRLPSKACCGYSDDSDMSCSYTNKAATDRHGCNEVVVSYARLAEKVLAAAAVVTAFFGLLSLVASLTLSNLRGKKNRPASYIATDIETKKGFS